MLNSVTLVGRVGGDPDIKYMESGKVMCQLNLAVQQSYNKEDPPCWIKLTLWGKTAEVAADYVRKGSLIGVVGSLKQDTWVDKQTEQKRSAHSVTVNELRLLGSKGESQEEEEPQRKQPAASGKSSGAKFRTSAPDIDEDIPF